MTLQSKDWEHKSEFTLHKYSLVCLYTHVNLSDAALFLKFNMMFAAVTVSTRDVRDYSPSAVMSLVQKY